MRIQRKLQFNALFFIVLIIILGSIIFSIFQQIDEFDAKENIVNNLVKSIFERSVITSEYSVRPQETTRVRWEAKENEINEILEFGDFEFTEKENVIISEIINDNLVVENLFAELVMETPTLIALNNEATPALRLFSAGTIDRRQRLIATISVRSLSIVSNGFRLSQINDEIQAKTKITIIILFIVSFIFMLLLISVITYSVARSITKPLLKLTAATEEIKKGKLDVKLNIKSNDELEKLGESFDGMVKVLNETNSVRKELDKAKTRFLSITSHELRSPMTPMKAQLQMVEQGFFGEINDKQRHALKIVISNANHLDKIIVDFLEISRIEAARLKFVFRQTNVGELIKEDVEYMKNYIPKKKVEVVSTFSKLPVIELDPDRVSQVLRNLIGNAIKCSKPNTKVIVGAKLVGKNIVFSVKDSGIGIPLESQKRIFEPFFQAEQTIYREKGGTGLGLAICKGLVESQGGKIWIESSVGGGSTFYFTFPLTPLRKVKAVSLLFSVAELKNKEIENLFLKYLGPLGKSLFETVKAEGINYENLFKYFSDLGTKGILDETQLQEIVTEIIKILSVKKEPKDKLKK